MNIATILIFALVAVSFASASSLDEAWKEYKLKHNKDYRSGDDDARKRIFAATYDLVQEHNNNNGVFKMDYNFFSDMTEREKSKYVGADIPISNITSGAKQNQTVFPPVSSRQLPTSFDSRTDPCTNAIKNQGTCGAGWAFAALAQIEFGKCKKTCNTTTILSEQHMIDCNTVGYGCNGGSIYGAWAVAFSNVALQSSYPYTAVKGVCKYNNTMFGAKISQYTYLNDRPDYSYTVAWMQGVLKQYGILTVGFKVVNSLYSYKSGVYYDCNCQSTSVNHAVNIVGYGDDGNGNPYWIARNSWGTGWGLSGYFLVLRGVNMCNVETQPSYADVL